MSGHPSLRPITIAGGGVAGLALGVALANRGMPVSLYDKGMYPRHRVCGEFICGVRENTLEKLGLGDLFAHALRHRSTVWFREGNEVLNADLPFSALGISRFSMDQRMADRFVEAGGVLHSKTEFTEEGEGIVWATGRIRERGEWLGLKIHCRDYALTGNLEVHLGKQAYVGASGVEDGRVNVCGLFRRVTGIRGRGEQVMLRYLEAVGLTYLKDKILDADPDVESYCGVSHFTFERPVGFWKQENRSLERFGLGDQLGVIPPFTGNGMSIALETAALALEPILDYAQGNTSWQQAMKRFRSLARRHLRTRFRVANAVQPLLLNPRSQRWVAGIARRKLLPFGPLFALTHGV